MFSFHSATPPTFSDKLVNSQSEIIFVNSTSTRIPTVSQKTREETSTNLPSKYEVQGTENSLRMLSPPIREQIFVPKELYKKGGTFRVNDCYYDDDGEFLYRVPGMTGKQQ